MAAHRAARSLAKMIESIDGLWVPTMDALNRLRVLAEQCGFASQEIRSEKDVDPWAEASTLIANRGRRAAGDAANQDSARRNSEGKEARQPNRRA